MTTRSKQSSIPKPSPVDDLFAPSKSVPPQPNILGSPFVPPQSQQQLQPQTAPQPPREGEPQQPSEEQPPFGISKTMAIAICALVIIAAIIGLIIYLILHNRQQKPDPKQAGKPDPKAITLDGEEEESPEDKQKRQQEAARLELQRTHVELEQYRKNDTILKSQLNQYAQLVRKLESENEDLRKASDTNNLINTFRQQQGMPTENGYIDVPDKPKEGPKTDAEKTTKEKRQELMNMVNQPRKTVADMQQEEADLKEASEQVNEELDRKAIDAETNAKIFVIDEDDVDDATLIASVNSGK